MKIDTTQAFEVLNIVNHCIMHASGMYGFYDLLYHAAGAKMMKLEKQLPKHDKGDKA